VHRKLLIPIHLARTALTELSMLLSRIERTFSAEQTSPQLMCRRALSSTIRYPHGSYTTLRTSLEEEAVAVG